MNARGWALTTLVALLVGVVGVRVAGATDEKPLVKAAWSALAPQGVLAREFFVAPDGKESNPGTREAPWDLKSVLAGKHPLDQGGVVWMRGGTYPGPLESQLKGAKDAPVILRQCPGERATIEGALAIGGENAWYWGFELTHANPSRTTGGSALDLYNAPNVKLINVVVHDTNGVAVGAWVGAVDAEICGCLIYYNGFQGPGRDRGHCHGIYTQNKAPSVKHIHDNIIFDQFSFGIHAYTQQGFVQGYEVEGNICFNNGVLSRGAQRTDNILFVSGDNVMKDIHVRDNYTYFTPSRNAGSNQLNWHNGGPHEDIEAVGNYWIGGKTAVDVRNWDRLVFTGNTVYSEGGTDLGLNLMPNEKASDYRWDNNTYYGSDKFMFQDKPVTWDEWLKQTGLDAHSTFTPGQPKGVWVFLRPDRYEPGRANICIYNWDLKDRVEVDLSKALKVGDAYEVRDAQDFFGKPVAAGVYQGGTVSLPMTGLSVAAAKGDVPTPPEHTSPQFGAFVVLPVAR